MDWQAAGPITSRCPVGNQRPQPDLWHDGCYQQLVSRNAAWRGWRCEHTTNEHEVFSRKWLQFHHFARRKHKKKTVLWSSWLNMPETLSRSNPRAAARYVRAQLAPNRGGLPRSMSSAICTLQSPTITRFALGRWRGASWMSPTSSADGEVATLTVTSLWSPPHDGVTSSLVDSYRYPHHVRPIPQQSASARPTQCRCTNLTCAWERPAHWQCEAQNRSTTLESCHAVDARWSGRDPSLRDPPKGKLNTWRGHFRDVPSTVVSQPHRHVQNWHNALLIPPEPGDFHSWPSGFCFRCCGIAT